MAQISMRSFGFGFLALFGLPFALIGCVTLYLAIAPLVQSFLAQSWSVVPAHILEASVVHSPSSKGSGSFNLIARYYYEVEGKRYESDKVSFYRGSDNIDTFHKDRFSEIEPYIAATSPYRAYVNPKNPAESVLFPVIRWQASAALAVFGTVFGVAGFGIILAAIVIGRKSREQSRLAANAPAQPWLHRKEWADRRIRCDSKARLILLGGLTVIWNGISSFVPFAIYREYQAGHLQYVMLIFLLFPIIGVLMLWGWIVTFLRWLRFGSSELTWEGPPLAVGGEFRGMLMAPKKLTELAQNIEITIVCQEHLTTGSGKNRSTRTTTVAENKINVALSQGMGFSDTSQIPLKLTLPASGNITVEHGNSRCSWKLTAHAVLPGSDFSAEFELPVFKEAPKRSPEI